MNSAVVVRNDAESFQDLGGSSQFASAYVTLSSPPPPTALLLGPHSPIAGTHPEPLLLLVPPSPLSGGAVQI